MAVTIDQLLRSARVTRVISEIRTPQSRLQNFFGMQVGGSAVESPGDISFSWDIFNATRTLAQGRPPGTGPGTTAPQKIGMKSARAYRSHEQIILLEAKIFRTRPLGSPIGTVDLRGQNYITRQEGYIAQRFSNTREFLVSRMVRNGFDLKVDGDNWTPVDTGNGDFAVSYGMNAENTSDFYSTLGAAWQTATTDIPGELLAVNAKMEELHGWPLEHIWLNSTTFNYVLKNDEVQALAGTANRPFETFVRDPDSRTGFTAVLHGIPWITWHIYDGGLEVDGTFTKFFPDNKALLCPTPTPEMASWFEGSEIVAENVMDLGREAFGFTAWTTRSIDPAGFQLKAVDIGLPVMYIPDVFIWGTVST